MLAQRTCRPLLWATLLLLLLAPGCTPTSVVGQDFMHRLGRSEGSAGDLDLCQKGQPTSMVADLQTDAVSYLPYGLLAEKVDPGRWQRCTERLLSDLDPERGATLIDHMGWAYRSLLRDRDLWQDRKKQAQLQALLTAYAVRPTGLSGHQGAMERLGADLRRALYENRLGRTAQKAALQLVAVMALEQGRWDGKAPGTETVDQLLSQADLERLRWFARRPPQAEVREQARRAVVQLVIERSNLLRIWPELRARKEQIEESLLREGRYPVPLETFRPQRAWLQLSREPAVVIEQQVPERRATLSVLDDRDRPMSSLFLRGVFQLEVRGLSHPVGLCGPPRTLSVDPDPLPCLPPGEIAVEHPLVQLSPHGVLSFSRQLSIQQVVSTAQLSAEFLVPFTVGGQAVLVAAWPLRFVVQRPGHLVFTPPSQAPGAPGPDLHVRVDNHIARRLIFTVDARVPYHAVVEADEASDLEIVSSGNQGAGGSPGIAGRKGRRGRDGYRASCTRRTPGFSGENGEDGEPGGPGGAGGAGGPGGDVRVDLSCGDHDCSALRDLLRGIIHSQGGEGGPGGSGGPGGPGGEGGQGGIGVICRQATDACITAPDGQFICGDEKAPDYFKLLPGPPGQPGRPGRQGPEGPPGPQGPAGQVHIHPGP